MSSPISSPCLAISSRCVPVKTPQNVHIELEAIHHDQVDVDIEQGRSHIVPIPIYTDPISGPSKVNASPLLSPPLPFPKKKMKDNTDAKYEKFIEVLKSLNITIPFTDALTEMPAYAKFLKDILARKRSIPNANIECNSINLSNHCSALDKDMLPAKLCDPGRFTITIGLGNYRYKALVDLGASASLLPLSIWSKINIGDLRTGEHEALYGGWFL